VVDIEHPSLIKTKGDSIIAKTVNILWRINDANLNQ
jgi:hypothetical protein